MIPGCRVCLEMSATACESLGWKVFVGSLPLPCHPGPGVMYLWLMVTVCSLIPSCLCFQAMRFPPKSYNKDLESAEVRSHLGSGLPAMQGGGFENTSLVTLPGSDTCLPTSAVYPCPGYDGEPHPCPGGNLPGVSQELCLGLS